LENRRPWRSFEGRFGGWQVTRRLVPRNGQVLQAANRCGRKPALLKKPRLGAEVRKARGISCGIPPIRDCCVRHGGLLRKSFGFGTGTAGTSTTSTTRVRRTQAESQEDRASEVAASLEDSLLATTGGWRWLAFRSKSPPTDGPGLATTRYLGYRDGETLRHRVPRTGSCLWPPCKNAGAFRSSVGRPAQRPGVTKNAKSLP